MSIYKCLLCKSFQLCDVHFRCGLVLTTSELDKIWATLSVGPDGMYSYSALIRHFIQFKVAPGAEEKRSHNYGKYVTFCTYKTL